LIFFDPEKPGIKKNVVPAKNAGTKPIRDPVEFKENELSIFVFKPSCRGRF